MYLKKQVATSPFRSPGFPACRQLNRLSRLVVPLLLTILIAAPLWSQGKPGTPTIAVPTAFAGIIVNNSSSHYPPSGTNFGIIRLWDTVGTSWPAVQTQSGTTLQNTSTLAQVLADAYNNSPSHDAVAMYTLNRTPYFASNVNDQGCNYYNGAKWGGGSDIYAPGQCDPPSDLNQDGSGANTNWINWITALAGFLNGLGSGHAPVKYFEIWNEIDRSKSLLGQSEGSATNLSYQGTYAQLLRMTEDARCILLGSSAQPTIHGTGLACSHSTGLMSGVMIVSPSSHAQGTGHQTATSIEQNFLHCDGPDAPPSGTYCTWSVSSPWGSNAVDIINFHMKPGNVAQTGGNTDPENEMATEYGYATSVYKSPDTNKPLWNGESGYSGASPCGWTPAVGEDVDLNPYPGQQAAFVGRYMLIQWSLGIQNSNWYQWDNSNFLEGSCSGGTHTNGSTTDAGTAYSTVATWMLGSTMSSTGCAIVSTYTDPQGTKSLWSCSLLQGSWHGKVFWDTNPFYQCHGSDPNPCVTYSYSPGGTGWNDYQTAIGSTISISPPYSIPVSNMPVIIETGAAPRVRE